MTLKEEGWKGKAAKGKNSVAMPGGNQAHVFKYPLPVKSHRMHLISPTMSCDMCEHESSLDSVPIVFI